VTDARRRIPLVSRLSVGQWFALASGLLAIVTATGTMLGVIAIARLSHARTLVVDRNGPAVVAALQLSNALLDEETGVRGYALTGDSSFLTPYREGRAAERAAYAALGRLSTFPELAQARRDTVLVRAGADMWHRTYADPTIARVAARGPRPFDPRNADRGKRAFDAIRAALATENVHLARVRSAGRTRLRHTASYLTVTFAAIVVLAAVGLIGVVAALRLIVTVPLRRVGRGVRRASRGDFEHAIEGHGPRDVVFLAEDVDSMRRRIVAELSSARVAHAQLDAQARELAQSNAELEQFAYVASHDLQEPLRKVASFCQLLEQRYKGQLDERGEQYIAFAVDGAKRMQQLINDLLAFSRVGHPTGAQQVVDCDEVLRHALASLATAIEESGAEIVAGPLPRVHGEASLLAAVFQNLVGNALKFRGEAPPRIAIGAERDGEMWRFTCSDDGIGIEPDYAERIFMIFQRLHPKEAYAGTGIGLALCRKIVEHHGGRIWLDTESASGTSFCFTLPALP
jgi:signal transduction histidine kinase